jgi:hypothetical protein
VDAYTAASGGGHASPCKAAGGGGHVSPNKAAGGGGHANYEGSAHEDRIKVFYDDGDKHWLNLFLKFFVFFYSSVAKIASKILYVEGDRKWFFSPPRPPTHTHSPVLLLLLKTLQHRSSDIPQAREGIRCVCGERALER